MDDEKGVEQDVEQERHHGRADNLAVVRVGLAETLHVDKHDDEQKQHHDAAGVDQDLHGADEFRLLQEEDSRHAEEREQKKER